MSTLCLSPGELREVTGCERPTYQLRALEDMRIPARLRPNGTVCVFRSDIDPVGRHTKGKNEPDFGALRRVTA